VDYSPDSGVAAGAFLAIVIGYVVVILLAVAVGYVLQAVGFMLLFKKVGIETWIAWVPFYNTWKFLELGSQPGWISLLSLIGVGRYIVIVFQAIGAHRVGISFGKDTGWLVLEIFLPWLWCILLGRQQEVYDPRRLQAFGYPPPNAGYGSVPPRTGF
jgi:hypothetical protein